MKVRLDVVEQRAKLKPRRDPYWQRLAQGRYIGFRKMRRGAEGTWLARIRVPERVGTTYIRPDGTEAIYTSPYEPSPLGDFAHLPEGERFDAAKRAAEAWFKHIDHGGAFEKATVADACKQYVERLREKKGDDSAADAAGRFNRLIYADPLGRVDLGETLAAARRRLASASAREGRRPLALQPKRGEFACRAEPCEIAPPCRVRPCLARGTQAVETRPRRRPAHAEDRPRRRRQTD